jgi:hypothetical protein
VGALLLALATALTLGAHHPRTFAVDHLSLIVAAAGIGALATLIASTLTFALRR